MLANINTITLNNRWFFITTGVAHKNNPISQNAIAEEHAIPTLVNLMVDASSSEVKVNSLIIN